MFFIIVAFSGGVVLERSRTHQALVHAIFHSSQSHFNWNLRNLKLWNHSNLKSQIQLGSEVLRMCYAQPYPKHPWRSGNFRWGYRSKGQIPCEVWMCCSSLSRLLKCRSQRWQAWATRRWTSRMWRFMLIRLTVFSHLLHLTFFSSKTVHPATKWIFYENQPQKPKKLIPIPYVSNQKSKISIVFSWYAWSKLLISLLSLSRCACYLDCTKMMW